MNKLVTCREGVGKEIFDFLVDKLKLPASTDSLTVSFDQNGVLRVDHQFTPAEE